MFIKLEAEVLSEEGLTAHTIDRAGTKIYIRYLR
jgi:hypothetical protein